MYLKWFRRYPQKTQVSKSARCVFLLLTVHELLNRRYVIMVTKGNDWIILIDGAKMVLLHKSHKTRSKIIFWSYADSQIWTKKRYLLENLIRLGQSQDDNENRLNVHLNQYYLLSKLNSYHVDNINHSCQIHAKMLPKSPWNVCFSQIQVL